MLLSEVTRELTFISMVRSRPFWERIWIGGDMDCWRGWLPVTPKSEQRAREVYRRGFHLSLDWSSSEHNNMGAGFSLIVLETPPWFQVFGVNFLVFQYILPPRASLWPQFLIKSTEAVPCFPISSSLHKSRDSHWAGQWGGGTFRRPPQPTWGHLINPGFLNCALKSREAFKRCWWLVPPKDNWKWIIGVEPGHLCGVTVPRRHRCTVTSSEHPALPSPGSPHFMKQPIPFYLQSTCPEVALKSVTLSLIPANREPLTHATLLDVWNVTTDSEKNRFGGIHKGTWLE